MADDWIECRLADVCASIDYGLTAPATDDANGPKFLRITDMVSAHIDWAAVPYVVASDKAIAKYQLYDGDIVLARTGASTGASAYVKRPPRAVFASYLVRLRAKPGFDPRFLAYYLRSDKFWTFIRGVLGDKSAQPNASASTMVKAPLCIPRDEKEQHAIANVLGMLDDKIELNRRICETLEAMARALFASWFVDFDPVRAKAEGRDPCLPNSLSALFPARLVGSELGEIPEGWEVRRVGDLADLDRGLSYKGAGIVGEGGMPMVTLGCFAGGGQFKPEGLKRYRGEYRRKHVVHPGELLIANTDMTQKRVILGSPALLPRLIGERDYLFTHHTFAIRFKRGAERWKLHVFYSLLRPAFREMAEGFATGTTVLALPSDGVRNYQVVLPSQELRAASHERLSAFRESAEVLRRESGTLAALRDTLLPKLISGELRVKDAERIVGHAT